MEVRTTPASFSIREAANEGEESRVIQGTAIVFNQPFDVEDYAGNIYREIIAPEAATMEFLKTQDIKMNLLHNRDNSLARWNKGTGNMTISVDDKGVHFEFEAPKCDIGDRCLELVRAGVYSGCSFEFWPKDYEVAETKQADGKSIVTVTHTAFECISALTIAMDPAYKQTSVNVDELREATPEYAARKAEEQKQLARQREVAAARARLRQRYIDNELNY